MEGIILVSTWSTTHWIVHIALMWLKQQKQQQHKTYCVLPSLKETAVK